MILDTLLQISNLNIFLTFLDANRLYLRELFGGLNKKIKNDLSLYHGNIYMSGKILSTYNQNIDQLIIDVKQTMKNVASSYLCI